MWKPPLNFITLHYCYIIGCSILAFIIIYPYGNVSAIDAYFFGASGSTESGLNTVDVKALKTYQQLVIYFVPIITNLMFVNIIVVVVRLHWFEKRLKRIAPTILSKKHSSERSDNAGSGKDDTFRNGGIEENALERPTPTEEPVKSQYVDEPTNWKPQLNQQANTEYQSHRTRIAFAPDPRKLSGDEKALYVPPPKAREQGHPLVEVNVSVPVDAENGDDLILPVSRSSQHHEEGVSLRRFGRTISTATSIERMASNLFVIGGHHSRDTSRSRPTPTASPMPQLSKTASVGRNSQFYNLSAKDRQLLGGIEYRALKLLLKIVITYCFGLNIFTSICLAGWIETGPAKYREYLASQGQDRTWWAFYSGATMANNLGYTLTPDSMISFRDATWPMLLMTFAAYAGNTLYPVFLRLVIWLMHKVLPKNSSTQEPLRFLLDHPRRCYTLLFPSRPTWILLSILVAMNVIDVILIVCLDLDNPELTALPLGPRILASIFQSASSRHTGTATFNLANVNPAVQFSLLVMMYIAVFPIAISIRASNTYEERSLGLYSSAPEPSDTDPPRSYLINHMRNQLSFDLWYIFLGIFCICIAEADRIMDNGDPAFTVFTIFFECTSAYGNVGLSLGYPSNLTSLAGHFTTFSKVVICALMIRGRHRMLPYAMDRAIVLPCERELRAEYFDEIDSSREKTT